jgi:hypothetical protein
MLLREVIQNAIDKSRRLLSTKSLPDLNRFVNDDIVRDIMAVN